jgi:hypothetical protein
MGRTINPARTPGTTIPMTQSGKYATGQTFKKGAVLTLSAGELIEDTSPVTGATIIGIAAEAAGSRPGYNVANSDVTTVYTNREQEISYVRADPTIIWSGQLVNNSATAVTPGQTDIGVNYGLKAYSGEWYVDKNQTAGNACVTVVDIDTQLNIVFFKIMPARVLAA